MKKIIVSTAALNQLKLFKSGQQNLVFKIFELITAIQDDPFKGIGKPEPLKENYQGFWSRRINDEHRLIYKVTENFIEIVSCFGHYT
jgi:toxin YoeB